MEQSKAEILSELYSVRSVLSIVSQNEDEVNYIINNEINPRKQTIESIERKHKDREDDIKNKQRKYLEEQRSKRKKVTDDINKNNASIEESLRNITIEEEIIAEEKSSYKSTFIKQFFWGFLTMLFPVGIIMFTIRYALWDLTDHWSFALVYLAVWIIANIIYAIFKSRDHLERAEREREVILNLQTSIESYKADIASLESLLAEIDSKTDNCDICAKDRIKLNEEIKKDEVIIADIKKKINECIDKILEIKSKSERLISDAKKAYQILDFRDWMNIDLIIFYFETGRADSVKEALYQVDRERQNKGLLGAMHSASSVLCRTINSSIAELSAKLNKSFEKLSQSLNEQSIRTRAVIEDNLSKSTALLQQQGEQTAKLIQSNYSSQEMNRALLEKISTSSDRLVADMESQLRANGIPYYS